MAFSSKGIKIALTKIRQMNEKYADINLIPKVILPAYRAYPVVDNKRAATLDYAILIEYKDVITFTPAGQHDDTFILKFSMEMNGLVLSNDRFEDKKFTEDAELHSYYSKK